MSMMINDTLCVQSGTSFGQFQIQVCLMTVDVGTKLRKLTQPADDDDENDDDTEGDEDDEDDGDDEDENG